MASTGSSSSRAASEPATAGVDLVIGLTSFNDAETIAGVVAAAREGVTRFLGAAATRFVLADAGSADDTAARARAAVGDDLLEVSPPGRAADVLNLPYHGMPGRA